MEQQVITTLIADYSQKEEQKEKESVWQSSVVRRLPCLNGDLRIEFSGEQIMVQENQQQSNYQKIFEKNILRVKEMRESLETY